MVAALADNGGTEQTAALQTGSPAIDIVPTNNCLSTDERAITRPQGAACDAGAYEYAPPIVATPAATQTGMTTGTVTATVTPNLSASDTTVVVNYGTTTSYGSSTASQTVSRTGAAASLTFSLSGLTAGTLYHAQVVATNGDGPGTSTDLTFTTAPPPPPPPVLAASVTSDTTLGATLTLTVKCTGGTPGQVCTEPVTVTTHETTQGTKIIGFTAAKKKKPKPKPKPKITKQVTIATGSASVPTGSSATVTIPLNATGKKLLASAPHYRMPATVTLGGTTPITLKVTYSYTKITSPISFTWSFGATSKAVSLSVGHVPKGGKVTVICAGGGCPFGSKTLTPTKSGSVSVAKALKGAKLRPRTSVDLRISAPNDVGKVAIFTMRSGAAPTLSESCLPPGAKKPTACL
jgi:hypothetical protein